MPYKEKETTKVYYTIGEVAKMFKVNNSLIRFWEKEFESIKPQKNKKGNRLFTVNDIETFKKIFHLVKDRGFTLDGAKKKLKEKTIDEVTNTDIVDSLRKIRQKLVDFKNELD